ncbi:TetR family transcriptional regulator [Sinomonas cellulolyticus]|jgi:AcrR family transcriptional regulator|uniref:TetR/AcrR family transcriptional regulator n=1 Tax=Sinomonas cellulolyticus TaxID=2801916 RepID=A0ABS1JXY9_9MICC|nr:MULTISPECIES: TetR/AcrR family transcriptional regulator [Sinomonas]MBL0704063.1 TetR/AcrR family transcriptional regulator [Sinomonas cellulolyticus]GHG56839.1 TetR family transcriptional regulator [Sinomonas sp. KCTC 49339]
MARPPRPERKHELLEEILDHLLGSTLADLTFRSIADGLGISSYVLVYHFGNREELVTEIIRGIMRRYEPLETGAPRGASREEFLDWARRAFELCLDHRGRHLQRLEFEASVQDVVAERPRRLGVEEHEHWRSFLAQWLQSCGVPAGQACSLARLYIATVMGLLYDFVLTGDREAALDSFGLFADAVMARLDAVAQHAGP